MWANPNPIEQSSNEVPGQSGFELSLPEPWKLQTGWLDPGTEEPGARPLRPSSCRSWLNSQTMAALRSCADRNWLSGKSELEVEKLFLGEFELCRTFLAENLMGFFFPPPHRFYSEAGQLLARLASGNLTEEDAKKSLLGYTRDQSRFAFLARLEPRDVYEAYSGGLSPGQVVTKDVKSHSLDIDVDFAPHRAAGLGPVDFAGRKWLAFVLVEDKPLSRDWLQFFGPSAPGDRVRFLWLLGGGNASFNDAGNLHHIVVAELWNGHSPARTLETLGQPVVVSKSANSATPPQPLSRRRPATWIINDESWIAKLGDTVLREVPDAVVARHDFVGLLSTLPSGSDPASGKDLPKSEEVLAKLLQTAPDASDLHYALGWVLNGAKRPDDALPHFERVLDLDPEHPLVFFDIGVSYALKGDARRAESSYQAALARYPGFTEAKLNLCALYTSTEEADKLKPACAAAVEVAPNNAGLLNNLARLFVTAKNPALRDPAKGLEYAKKAVSISNGKVSGFLDTLAEAFYANSQNEEAIQTEEKALALEPGNSEYKLRLEKYRRAKSGKQN
jgi:Flp pilus assembly protein TadD